MVCFELICVQMYEKNLLKRLFYKKISYICSKIIIYQ